MASGRCVQVMAPGDFSVEVSGGRRRGARLGGRLNGEGSAAVRVPGRHRDPEDVFHPRDTESARGEQDSAQCPAGEEQRPERTKARAQGEEIPLRGAP